MDDQRESNPLLREYRRLASSYDRRYSIYTAATVAQTVARVAVCASDRVLDVGCGTGELLRALEPSGAALFGCDASPEMLLQVCAKVAAPVVRSWAETLPFGDGCFDVVVSSNAFHFFDGERALAEMARVLRPGGRLVISDWCDDYLACRLCALALRVLRRPGHKLFGTRACREALARAGLRVLSLERYKINWFWGLMTAVAEKPSG